jgi:hypothetical protein
MRCGGEVWWMLGLVALCVFGYISNVVVEGAYIRVAGVGSMYCWYSRLVSEW